MLRVGNDPAPARQSHHSRNRANCSPLPSEARRSSTSALIRVFNFGNSTLYTRNQLNELVTLEPIDHYQNPAFQADHVLVRITTMISDKVDIDNTEKVLTELRETKRDEFYPSNERQLKNIYYDDRDRAARNNFTSTFEVAVPAASILAAGVYYCREANMTLTFDKRLCTKPNPNSDIGRSEESIRFRKETSSHAGVMVRVVDNHMETKHRFYFAGKVEVVVPCVQDPESKDGVYITTSNCDPDGALVLHSNYMTFEEAEAHIGLYKTRDQARTAGNPELLLKQEEQQNKFKLLQVESELLESKAEIARLQRMLDIGKINAAAAAEIQDLSLSRIKGEVDLKHKASVHELDAKARKRKEKDEKRQRKLQESREEAKALREELAKMAADEDKRFKERMERLQREQEAENRRIEAEAEAHRKTQEAKRKLEEAEAELQAKRLEAIRKAEELEAEHRRKRLEAEKKAEEEEAELRRKRQEAERRREEEEAEIRRKRLEAERRREEEEEDSRRRRQDAERRRLEEERDRDRNRMLEEESLRRALAKRSSEDYYDHRSYERKDSSEMLKILPTALAAGVALFAIMRK